MIFTDYYKGEKLTDAKSRYDITASTNEYDYFESLLINKRGFNVGGLSLNCISRPDRWKSKTSDLALTKGSTNITSLSRPDIDSNVSIGDIKNSTDACIVVFNPDFKESGIKSLEIFIARGLLNDKISLWHLFTDGELNREVEALRKQAKQRLIE